MANYGVSSNRELAAKVEAEAKFVQEVGRAFDLQTKGLTMDIGDYANSELMHKQVHGQVHKRALPVVLNFLKRCEDETFEQVLASVGGDLVCPSRWIEVLIKTIKYEPGCSLQIAESIGPLVRCMCNDTERIFFKSNKHWREGIAILIGVIYHMTKSNLVPDANEGNKEIIDVLLQHDGLLTSIVQWGFWNGEYRPDLVEDLGSLCGIVVTFGRNITRFIVHSITDATTKDKPLLEAIGATPIVSKAYDPTCMVSFLEGLIHQIKTDGWNQSDLLTFNELWSGIDCADKRVVIEMIDLGLNFTTQYPCALSLALFMLPMIREGCTGQKEGVPNDSRCAFTIRTGLIEMCFGFIERFREHESFANDPSGGVIIVQHYQKFTKGCSFGFIASEDGKGNKK